VDDILNETEKNIFTGYFEIQTYVLKLKAPLHQKLPPNPL
jgi:hypothetical protein